MAAVEQGRRIGTVAVAVAFAAPAVFADRRKESRHSRRRFRCLLLNNATTARRGRRSIIPADNRKGEIRKMITTPHSLRCFTSVSKRSFVNLLHKLPFNGVNDKMRKNLMHILRMYRVNYISPA